MDSGLVDAVSITTPNNVHVKIATAALSKKIPFAVEKPVGMNDEEVKALYQKALKQKHKNMVCFSYRFKSAARYARSIVRSGALGDIYHVYGQYLQSNAISPNRPIVWRNIMEIAGGGADGDLGCHLMDLVTFITGLDYESVCAQGGNYVTKRKDPVTKKDRPVTTEDYCHILAQMDAGVTGVFNISRHCHGKGNYQRMEIYGSKGALVYTLDNEDTLEACIGEPYTKSSAYCPLSIPVEFKTDQMQSFFDIVNGKGDGLAATLADGFRAQQLITAVMKSFGSLKWISVKK